ncbi:hypothetical protein LJC58_10405, partial [Lachnospiraceae bacterium OttesenSCG-928-D06]|nr:hypothetical protein [Lachnospiraceae bacterium OttesenSCG-928-D06]
VNGKRMAIRPHSANDGYVTIGYGHAIQSDTDAKKYGFETGQIQPVSDVLTSISEQMNKYSSYTQNPAILSLVSAEELLTQDLMSYRENATIFAEEMGRTYLDNEIDAMTSLVYNGNRAYDPDSLLYHFLRQNRTSSMNIIRKADSKGWYNDNPGLFRRRLMEFNIFFNNDYTFYDSDKLSELKTITGF